MEGTIGQILLFAASFAPRNWAYCQGQILSISSNTALFSILGTTYGGNGQTTFALPNLAGRTAVGVGTGAGLSNVSLGEMAGTPSTTLTTATMPAHTHQLVAASNSGNAQIPTGALLATNTDNSYAATGPLVAMNNGSVGMTGSSAPFNNMQPYLGMNYVICLFGIFPSRN